MLRDACLVSFLLAALLGLAQAATPTAQNASPPKPAVEPPPDPASAHFTAPAGLLIVAVKPTAVADYELVIRTVQEALSKDTNEMRVAAAKGWHVFKATENDAKGNALYIHVMMPTVTGFDYRPSLLLDELIKDLAPEMLVRYQDSFAVPPTRLNLNDFAAMSVAPLPPAEKKPGG